MDTWSCYKSVDNGVKWISCDKETGFYLITRRNAWEIARDCKLTGRLAVLTGLLLAWSVLAFNNVGTFLYFAF